LLGGSFGGGEILEMLADQYRVLDVDGAGVRLLFGDANLGQIVDQHLGLDFKFTRQFVNSDLVGFRH
jgi:hypothetical protein